MLEIKYEDGYYTFDYKQTSYTLRRIEDVAGKVEYELTSLRKNYGGRFQVPTYRFFNTIEEIEETIKGLKGLSMLIEAGCFKSSYFEKIC